MIFLDLIQAMPDMPLPSAGSIDTALVLIAASLGLGLIMACQRRN